MVRGRLRTLLVTLLAACCAAAGAAGPASAAMLGDLLEGQPGVADIGEMTATIRPDGVLETRTQVVARPPAGWGGCIPLVSGLCMLTEMDVTWRMSHRVGGAPGDGADARVVATPVWGQTAWRLDLWSDVAQRWQPATPPVGTTDAGGVSWSLPVAWLGSGIGDGQMLMRAISRFVPLDGAGRPQAAVLDDTHWLELPLPAAVLDGGPSSPAGPPSTGSPSARSPAVRDPTAPGAMPTPEQLTACNKARARVSTFDRRIRRAAKAAKRGPAARRRAARRELRRLRSQRDAALSSKRRTCAKASQPPSR